MTTLEVTVPMEQSQPADCELGDWIASSRLPAWNKKLPVQEHLQRGAGKPWLFVRGFGKAAGMMQTLWKRVE